jgi:hypothetical protein
VDCTGELARDHLVRSGVRRDGASLRRPADADAVSGYEAAIFPKAALGAGYVAKLDGGCAVREPRGAAPAWYGAWIIAMFACRLRRRPWLCAGGLGVALAACSPDIHDQPFSTAGLPSNSRVGEYQPDSRLGTYIDPDSDAGSFTARELAEEMTRDRGGTDPCMPLPPELGLSEQELRAAEAAGQDVAARPRTRGTMLASFKTRPLSGHWKPANTLAVWIEDVEMRGVRRLGEWSGRWLATLLIYFSRTCRADIDVVSQATLQDHGLTHRVEWHTDDFQGNIVPDGSYVLMVEENDADRSYGPRTAVPFPKGTQAFSTSVLDGPATLELTLSYRPEVAPASGPEGTTPASGSAGAPSLPAAAGAPATP